MAENIASRACTKCTLTKLLTEFYSDPKKRDGHHTVCKECIKAERRARYATDPGFRARSAAGSVEWYRRNTALTRRRRQTARLEMIEAYGAKCVCCGEAAVEFLTMDHVGGWGAEHRAADKSAGSRLPFLLKKQGWPKNGYQLLCWNCNCARGIYGYCPHGRLV